MRFTAWTYCLHHGLALTLRSTVLHLPSVYSATFKFSGRLPADALVTCARCCQLYNFHHLLPSGFYATRTAASSRILRFARLLARYIWFPYAGCAPHPFIAYVALVPDARLGLFNANHD